MRDILTLSKASKKIKSFLADVVYYGLYFYFYLENVSKTFYKSQAKF